MSQFDVKMTELADKIKSKNTAVAGKLSVQGMIEAVNGIIIGGGAGDSTVKFGYWNAEGKFQEVDLSGDSPVDSGEPVEVNAVMFDTGKDAPDYGGGTVSAIEFYECASYTPNVEAHTRYIMTLSGAADEKANGTYVRTKWVETVPENWTDTPIAVWTNENGYTLKEYYYSELNYEINDSNGSIIYNANEPYWSRVTDFNTIPWVNADWEELDHTLTFSAWQTEEVPATTEGWTGYKVTQNAETGAWSKSDTLTEGLTVTHLKPMVGSIYSSDTTIRVRKMYDGATYPITSNGLVFYAALEENYVDKVSGTAATVTGGAFTTHNGLRCLALDGSEYVQWPDNADLPAGDVPYSFVVVAAPTNNSDWKCYASIGYEGSDEIAIHAKNGRLEEFGPANITADGKWHALALTRDAPGCAKTYINGRLDGTGERTNAVPSPAHVCVGIQANGGGQAFTGYIAFVAIYNRELSADEVAEIHSTLMADVEQ